MVTIFCTDQVRKIIENNNVKCCLSTRKTRTNTVISLPKLPHISSKTYQLQLRTTLHPVITHSTLTTIYPLEHRSFRLSLAGTKSVSPPIRHSDVIKAISSVRGNAPYVRSQRIHICVWVRVWGPTSKGEKSEKSAHDGG